MSSRHLPNRRTVLRWTTVAGIAAALLVSLLAIRWHVGQGYSGDEPHYLIVANSLITDGDVDVKNDYLLQRYRRYYPQLIEPQVNTTIFGPTSPHWYSAHGVGLPAVLVPALALDDTRGATVEMAAIAVGVLLLTFFWARRFVRERWAAGAAVACLGVSPFFLGLEGRIFPDLPAAALLLGCLLLLELQSPRLWHLAALGVLVGLSPWFHFKNGLPFGTVEALAVINTARRNTGSRRAGELAVLVLPALVSAIGYEAAVHDWYGSWLPTAMVPPHNDVLAIEPGRGLAASLFDSARGLLSINPALLLMLVGVPIWFRCRPRVFLRLALVIAPSIVLQSTFNDWSGGFAPAGRYALQFAPALVPAVAIALQELTRPLRAIAAILLALQGALAAAFVWLRPSWGFAGTRSPFLSGVADHFGVALDRLMPTFDVNGALIDGGWKLAAWCAVSGAMVAFGVRLSRHRPFETAAEVLDAAPQAR
jgi:hypothetical protein